MHVPFLNLKAQHDPLKQEIASAIQEVIESSAFAGGPFVERFEQDFAAVQIGEAENANPLAKFDIRRDETEGRLLGTHTARCLG